MNKKMKAHELIITAIVIAVFAAAVFSAATFAPTEKDSKASGSSVVINLAKVDFENRSVNTDNKVIADNEIPLADAPSETGVNMPMWWIIVAASVLMMGVVLYEDLASPF